MRSQMRFQQLLEFVYYIDNNISFAFKNKLFCMLTNRTKFYIIILSSQYTKKMKNNDKLICMEKNSNYTDEKVIKK